MTEEWRIRLLGGLGAFQGERAVTRFRTQRTGELLAYLAYHGGRVHPREVLMEVLWPDSDLDSARNSLSVALHSLRRQLEPPATPGSATGAVLIADRNSVQLRPAAFTTDVAAFETALDGAGKATGAEAVELLSQADRTYTGELLPGFYSDWVIAERERLADARRQALRRLTTLLMGARDFDRALHFAHRAVQEDPLNEAARRLLMRLYAALGRPSGVLEQLKEFEHLLQTTQDSALSPAMRELALRLAEGTDKEAEGDIVLPPAAATPAASAEGGSPTVTPLADHETFRLPMQFTRFFGRTGEIEEVARLFESGGARLVTLAGPGGVGKTRLSVEVATRLREKGAFPGGIWFVPLADLDDPRRLFETLRDRLKLQRASSGSLQQQVTNYLTSRKQPCLLVLDNLEHLLGGGSLDTAGGAWAVDVLVTRVPNLSVLVTSRVALGSAGERIFAVAPLPVPSDAPPDYDSLRGYASISLFVDRAQARLVDFQMTPRNAAAIVRLCARLEGLPLAIELAAARAKVYTPSQMIEQLDAGGFETLDSPRTDIPLRHRGLWTAAAWSYDLLTPPVQRLFAGISVFRGRWSVVAAAAVCGEGEADADRANQTLDGLTRLRDASLLVAETASIGDDDEMRLRLLEPLREFAASRLPEIERDDFERRHAAYFLQLAEAAAQQILGPEQHLWFDRLEADFDNLRAALSRFAGEETGLRLAGALSKFWTIRGYLEEGADWLQFVLEADRRRGALPTLSRARALTAAGSIAYIQAHFDAARAFYQESLDALKALSDDQGIGTALNNLGNVAYRQNDYPTARRYYQEGLAQYRALDHRWGIASALGNLANVYHSEGDNVTARRLHEESLSTSQEMGDIRMTSYTFHNLANITHEEGDFAGARALYARSLELKRLLGDRSGIASSLSNLGLLALEEKDFPAARAHFREALQLAHEIGAQLTILNSLEGLAWHASLTGNDGLAAALWPVTAAAHDTLGAPYTDQEREAYAPFLAQYASHAAAPPLSLEAAVRRALEG